MLQRIALSNRFVKITLFSTFAFIFFLLFIDEGYYDLRWMKSIGNWIVGFIYWMVLFWLVIGVGFITKTINRK